MCEAHVETDNNAHVVRKREENSQDGDKRGEDQTRQACADQNRSQDAARGPSVGDTSQRRYAHRTNENDAEATPVHDETLRDGDNDAAMLCG